VFRNVKHNHEERTIHPCQFPEDLIARIVLTATDPGDVVLDPYMGVGTVAVVARDLGRVFLGAETEPKYHEVALRRLSGQPNGGGAFANLKALRDHAERTGVPAHRLRFDVQTSANATARSQARIYPEEHHRAELVRRLSYEEACFGADVRREERPADPGLNGRSPRTPPTSGQNSQQTLFEG
jgi:adenine-specific DNA-methyltransferase